MNETTVKKFPQIKSITLLNDWPFILEKLSKISCLNESKSVTLKATHKPKRISKSDKKFCNSTCLRKDLRMLCDNAKNKNITITNSPKKPAPSNAKFSGPDIPEVEITDRALTKLV